MDDIPWGVIEIGLAFGALLAWATWEVVRNRRELVRLRSERASADRPDADAD